MEYEDELERMRRRRQRQRETQGRDSGTGSGRDREPELSIMDFDDWESGRAERPHTQRRQQPQRRPRPKETGRPPRGFDSQGTGRPQRRSDSQRVSRPQRISDAQGAAQPQRKSGSQGMSQSQRRRLKDIEYDDERFYETPNDRKNGRRTQGEYNNYEDEPRGKKKKKKGRFSFLKLLLILVIGAGLYFGYRYFQGGSGIWTIAVFGVDSRNGGLEKGALSDVEMLCVIDRKTGEIKLVSVYRDTYLEISPDGTYHKINEAYFKGGHEQAVEALERNLDLTIDDYATFNWKAVADAITILGGIDLEISDSEFKYINAFITETVESTGLGSHHLEHAGMNHLDGVQAVAYARLRLMDTDYNRTARQRLVIQLAMNKAKEADFKTLSIVAQTVIPQLSTSISLDDVISMARNIKKYHIGETGGFPFSRGETNIGKKDCVIPLTLESNVIQLHQFLYGTGNYQPSATVKQISARIASDSGMGEVAENAPEAKVRGQRALEDGGENPAPTTGGSPAPAGNEGEKNGAVGNETMETAAPETEASVPETGESEMAEESSGGDEVPEEEDVETESSEKESSAKDNGSQGEETEKPSVESSSQAGGEIPDGPDANLSGEAVPVPDGPGSSGDREQGDNVYDEKPVIETEEVGPGV